MKLGKIVILLVALFFIVPQVANLWVDYLWFGSLGYASVFIKILSTKVLLGIAGLVTTSLFLWANLKVAGRRSDLEDLRLKARLKGFESFGIVSILLGVVSAFFISSYWMEFLKFFNATPFGKVDAVFQQDLSFYFFKLPLYNVILNYAAVLLFSAAVIVGIFYFIVYQKKLEAEEEDAGEAMEDLKSHVAPLAGIFLLVVSIKIYLGKYWILFSERGAVFGAAYTDVNITLPLILISSVVCFISGLVFVVYPKLKKIKYPLYSVGVLIAVAIVGSAASGIVQSFYVEPNEYDLEKKYIERNIESTLQAYGIDRIDEREFSANYNLSSQDVQERNQTIGNIRLWDHRALKDTYSQLQLIRSYYSFNDIDIDRYHLDGSYKQVMLSAREMEQRDLPEKARTWVNQHLVYTHGSGVVMSPVSEVSEQGLPIFYLKDIPPKVTESAPASEPLSIENPDIYYGQSSDSFVITQTSTKEFDYPKGNQNIYTSYNGSGGVKLGGGLRKLAMSLYFGDIKILVSSALKSDSKILFRRKIEDRTRRIAPFLSYDKDPYTVIHDGGVSWIIDSYTTSNSYPYSEPMNGYNYIRNSIKTVVDGYNGNVDYYVVEEEPMVDTYRKIFPELFKGFNEMPNNIKKHIRYPEGLFKVQSQMYSTYHMEDSKVFYNKEDQWQVPRELYKGASQPMEPYYITMELPGENETQFILMTPFTPKGKDNMIAWLGAKSDIPQYGEKVLYKFSKQRLIYGPQQIESRINQDAEISQQITLWSQSGSDVIRGNLLVVPVKDSLLYVEPLFLRSSGDAIPELKRVIVAFGDDIAMEPTLRGCIEEIFVRGEEEGEEKPPEEEATERELIQEAKEHYEAAQRYLSQGDFTTYAREIESLGQVLEKLSTQESGENQA